MAKTPGAESDNRVNIGNARLYGMEEDLGLKQNQFQIAVSLLFVSRSFRRSSLRLAFSTTVGLELP